MNKHGSKWIRPERRFAIYARDGFECVYCLVDVTVTGATLDHVVCREAMGTHASDNLVTACVSCNSRRRDKAIHLFATEAQLVRVWRQTRKPVDIALGKRLVAARKGR